MQQLILFSSILVQWKQLLHQNLSNGNTFPWSVLICVSAVSNFSSACLSVTLTVWKPIIGCTSLPQSFLLSVFLPPAGLPISISLSMYWPGLRISMCTCICAQFAWFVWCGSSATVKPCNVCSDSRYLQTNIVTKQNHSREDFCRFNVNFFPSTAATYQHLI